ncbi:protein kinase [Rhodococcus sp. T2V]|uniref:serine/threonine-protein kinase n=1 Tax=Rhodococcus sp. T2V TaxID=3034164 RepID=UPI0023E188B7|nr:serine/threonine-protein kinase [Rhodococcus sp. T2V]MDF3307991.1 protein kinase [Rhodococcus sp. T2V]
MAGSEPLATTQRDPIPGIVAELAAVGLTDATEIGRGGFGIVYRCQQSALNRTVAVKVLTADFCVADRERFVREQLAMGQLSGHPHIVDIHEVGTTASDRPYLVMQYRALGSLDTRIRRGGPLGWAQALRLGVKLAGALETAHRLGVLHRDVKPGNVLLTDYNEPQLTDFGIARISGGFQTAAGTITGSPAFTAPEVLHGQPPSPVSDLYSLGATLFCAITGHAAFERRSGEQLVAQFLRITTQPVPDLRGGGIPDDVSSAIEHAMAGDPDQRPPTASTFGNELREIQAHHHLPVDEMALPTHLRTPEEIPAEHGDRAARVAQLTPPTPATRFRPPNTPHELVPRTRLIDTLRAGQPRRLTVIHAPTGFGKSTLASQWSENLADDGVAVAWLTVNRDDNNVVWFLSHLIEAIRRVRPALAREMGLTLEEHGDQAEHYILTSLINEIHQAEGAIALVIDDWHRVTNPDTVAALAFLIDNGCHHLQIIVTTRTQMGLPLSRMRVLDELTEIDASQLRFSPDESRAFLAESGLKLPDTAITELSANTEGWAAALQLALLSLRKTTDPGELIGHLSGRHHSIGEFLADNVLDTLEPQTLDYLMATSVTERISGSLASVLTRSHRGQAILEDIEERDLFLHRLDDEGQWFRYHHMFAEFLQKRLERDQPERVVTLHEIAAEWFGTRGLLSEAVDHALAAGKQTTAVRLLERDGMSMLEHAQMASFLALIAKLPPGLVEHSPRLQLTTAWAECTMVQPHRARAALARVYRLLETNQGTDHDTAELRSEADVVQGHIAIESDRIGGVDDLMSRCLRDPGRLPPWVVSAAADIATFVDIHQFRFDTAIDRQVWARPYHDRTTGPFSVMFGHCFAGLAHRERLALAEAEAEFREALRLGATLGGTQSRAARLASALLAELLYEQGHITEAEQLLYESNEIRDQGGVVDFMLARYATGARIKALRNDNESAKRYLDEGTRIAITRGLPRLQARMDYERILLHPMTGERLDGIVATPYSHRRTPVDSLDETTVQLEEATAIQLLLFEPNATPQTVALACEWAGQWVQTLEGRGRPRAALDAQRLLVEAFAAAGRTEQAKHLLTGVMAKCARIGLRQYLLDGGPHVPPLVRELRQDVENGHWQSNWEPVPSTFLDDVSVSSEHPAPERNQASGSTERTQDPR